MTLFLDIAFVSERLDARFSLQELLESRMHVFAAFALVGNFPQIWLVQKWYRSVPGVLFVSGKEGSINSTLQVFAVFAKI